MFPSANPSTAPPSRKAGSTSRTNSVATDGGSRPSSVVNFGGGSRANSVVNDGGGSARSSVSGDAMDVDAAAAEGDEDKTSEASGNQKEDARLVLQDYIYVPDPEPKNIWTVEEDLRLLEGIQQHGLGNWVDIAEFVSGNGSLGKAPRKCMERYFDDFLGRYGHILPPYTIVEEDDNKEDDEDDTDKEESNKTASTPGKSMDPTRVSQRSLSAQKRKTSLLTQQSLSSRLSNKKLKLVPTESLPEYKKILEMFPNPRIPVKDPPVQAGQKVGRFEAARAEREYINEIAKVKDSPEEVKKIREHWERTRLNQPGGPTVLPVLDNHVAEMPGSNLAGFMPRRGDFDIEYENNAEEALADMEFLPGDREDEKELKLKVLRIYNEKLDEREKRKKFILERELYDYRKNLAENEKNMPQDERDLIRRMRLFERFHTKEEHEQFIQDILKAKRLRKEIAKLQTYRRMGMTSMVEAEKYELDKITRENHKHAAKNAAEAKEAATAQTGASGDNPAVNSKVEESVWKQYQKPRRSSSRGTKDSATSAPPDGTSTLEKSKDDGAVQNKEDDVPKPMEVDSDKQQQGKTDRDSSADADFVLEKMEGVELLSDKEKELLRRIQLTPKQFLDVKKVLIHESLRSGMLDKEKEGSSRTLVHIDVKKRGDVIDFMVQAGWVKSKIGRTISE